MITHAQLLHAIPGLCLNVLAVLSTVPGPRRRSAAGGEDLELLARLRAGEEDAFLALVARHNAMLLRLAGSLVSSRAVAEEVVQDTWLGALRGLDGLDRKSTRLNSSHVAI